MTYKSRSDPRALSRPLAVMLLAALGTFVPGCGVVGLFSHSGYERVPDAPSGLSAIEAALWFLEHAQLADDIACLNSQDYAGDWPQYFGFHEEGPYIRESSPFAPAFIHHTLSLIDEGSYEQLGLSLSDVVRTRTMRQRAIAFMERFRAQEGMPDAGTYGFWPIDRYRWFPGDFVLERLIAAKWGGPMFRGYRTPLNVSFFPREYAIPADADVTAVVYAALLDHNQLDNGPTVDDRFAHFFADWRDLGQIPQRNIKPWISSPTGAFLTWLDYGDPSDPSRPNDVDIVVNANVLYVLGRYHRLEVPGVSESIALINGAIAARADYLRSQDLSLYYPDNLVLHYFVARAYAEGGVAALRPAVDALVDDLLASVQTDVRGYAYWDHGQPHLNTALGALTLLLADQAPDIAQSAISYLMAEQRPSGGWAPDVFFLARLDDGTRPVWLSQSFTTAMALEAICRERLSGSR